MNVQASDASDNEYKMNDLHAKRTKPNNFLQNGVPFSDLMHNPFTHSPKEDDPYFYKFNIARFFNVDKTLAILPSQASLLYKFLKNSPLQPTAYNLLTFHTGECSMCGMASLLDFYRNDFIMTGEIYRSVHIKMSVMTEAEIIYKRRIDKGKKCLLNSDEFINYHENELIGKNAPIDVYELALFLRRKKINVLLIQENVQRPEENEITMLASVSEGTMYAVIYMNRNISGNVMLLTKNMPDQRIKLLFSPQEFFDEILNEVNITSAKHSSDIDINPIKKIEKKLSFLYYEKNEPRIAGRPRRK